MLGPFLAPWRELRRQQPYLFYRRYDPDDPSSLLPLSEWKPGPARLWTQENATEDNVIASWLTELVAESGIKQCLKSVDCVASEHTPHMEAKIFLSQQIVHCIGMRQTAKMQVTDVRFARIGKLAGEKVKARRRRLHRIYAKLARKPTTLTAQHVD